MRNYKTLNINAKPFIKWVGGKGQLLNQLETNLPNELYHEDFTYIEPFVGGGAMLFFMLQKFPNIKRAVINDINPNLTNAYGVVKKHPKRLIDSLKIIEKEYLSIKSEEARKDFYLQNRNVFNNDELDTIQKTSLLLFLNKTCFNGLYRENSKGQFNVPFGKYSNPTICNEELIYTDSELLNQFNVSILCGDFEQTKAQIRNNELTFFYFDPPYRPLNATSSFNTYVKDAFDDADQIRLAAFCKDISNKNNCLWLLSNSDCSAKNPNDLFFESLYHPFEISRVYASRSVNAIASKRGKLSELLIKKQSLPTHKQRKVLQNI